MRIISFAWTTPALLAGYKTVTRRDWTADYAGHFSKGDLVQAYNRNPRWNGRRVATIRLIQDPYLESTRRVAPSDYIDEGFAYLESIGAKVDGLTPQALWESWHVDPQNLWVVRFEVVGIAPGLREVT